ncbi:ABC transporter substrate-binding protein [Kaistia dalseonensis]|uniref:Multiple sugar transport system substrate-binding protein n=1 Tax=Kaistia dalseonensis TaxID=410840 RepID=A0ABU0H6K4_9HYPH|nr:ABC transporter substrate-binding protein [Kaistia dalseonensis]MCX5494829.1 ABC transporter substrate-binding protein [Kaistia dalseonensis]MDQ0437410.1 multiple sugar transport system substrate-binding protein [Kaistia dalseonensis]
MRGFMKKALATAALLAMTAGAQAKETVVWWDFLSGGDGVRMKALLDQFNKENPDIEIQATTLEWGVPFYTKVQTSAAVGEGPDVMTYHLSRLPLGVSTGTLRELTPDELKAAGFSGDNYAPANWKAAQVDGKQYAIPFDIHSIILYYNKDLLKKAGLLGDDGLPKGLDGAANFEAALKTLTTGPDQVGLSIPTADNGTTWRVFYTLLAQQGGSFINDGKVLDGDNADKATKALAEMAKWTTEGWVPKQTEYPASIALFTSGKAAMHINGVWEVPTMTDLAKSGKLGFEWGAIQIPVLFDQPATWADSHSFAVPNRKGKEISPEKLKAVLTVIKWMNEHSIFWATAGHIPAYLPVTDSDEFKKMLPNAIYSTLAKTATFDPSSTIAGVASPIYEAASNYFMPAFNGDGAPADAISAAKDELQGLLQ